jgi:hypothetical protein
MKTLFSGRRNVFLLIGFVLIVGLVVKARIDEREKEKALPSFEESIKTANTLLTADITKLPRRISLPEAEGKYNKLVHNFNAAVKDYYYKLIEYRDCDLNLPTMMLMSYFSPDALQAATSSINYCINLKKEYYESLSKLKDTYREASRALNPTVKLITKEKDERFKELDELLDSFERIKKIK